jgi:hypothetical protein
MSRLDDYQNALLATYPDVADNDLARTLDDGGQQFVSFVIDHGLGPMWHARTGDAEFHASRLSAEALFLAQEHALKDVDTALESTGIQYALIKGAASRLLLYENPAVRACHDLDVLVRPDDKAEATLALTEAGFAAFPEAGSICREMVLSRGEVNVDLHWALLREGRLRNDMTQMLTRRRRVGDTWMLSAEDALFVLLVHPAFTKHLGGWEMGLHRIVDIDACLRTQPYEWQAVRQQLQQNGVLTAAWATLRWLELLSDQNAFPGLEALLTDLRPGRLRAAWLDHWLRNNLSTRTSRSHWARLFGFSMFLHDAPRDAVRALTGRYRARRRSSADLAAFAGLFD